MKKQILICDRCKKEYNPLNGEGISFSVKIGSEMDASGNGYNTIYKDYDFCKKCISAKMQIYIDERRDIL